MSTNKSFSTETSERYSRALFEVAQEASELEKIENDIKNFASLLINSLEIKNFIHNPTQSKDNQNNVLNLLAEKLNFSKNLKNFMFLLIEKRRIFFVEKIIDSFLKLCAQKRGEVKASLISSKELSETELENISKALGTSISSSFNRRLRERRDEIEREIEKKTEDARRILEKEQEKTLTEEERQERERREGNQGIDSTNNGEEQDETGANTDTTGENGLPGGYVETAVTLCQNGSPVTGSILFKPDTP